MPPRITWRGITDGISEEQANWMMPYVRTLGDGPYNGRRLQRTEAVLEAAAALADVEIKEMADAGYQIAPANPIKRLNIPVRYNWLSNAITLAQEEERFK